jgi:hypothetical protein
MPTKFLTFRFPEHPKVRRLMEACASILRQTVDYALDHPGTGTLSIIRALYAPCRAQYPDLHSAWIQSAIRTGAVVVYYFRNGKWWGKTQAGRPVLRRPFVYVRKAMFKMEWNGKRLKVTFPVRPRDPKPVVLSFRPRLEYARLLDAWKAGEATMWEPRLTPHSVSIPIKTPRVRPIGPETTITGTDGHETNRPKFRTAGEALQAIVEGVVKRFPPELQPIMEAILWLQLSQYEATLRGNTLTLRRIAAPASDIPPHRLQEVPIPCLSDRLSAEDIVRLLAYIQGVYP